MLIMLNQRRRQTATERRPFAPFAGMGVDGRAAQDQRVGGGAAALTPSQTQALGTLSPPLQGRCRVGGSSAAAVSSGGSVPPRDQRLH